MFKQKKWVFFLILFMLLSSIFLIPQVLPTLNKAKILLLQTVLGSFALTTTLLLMKALLPDKKNLLVLVGLVGGLALTARLLVYYAGGPITWDELYYMYLSLFPRQESSLLNRYFHIYLQRFFFFLTNWDPFSGAKLYWAFCILVTAGFTFYSTYTLIPSKRESTKIIGGIFSLLVYFTFPYILDYPGVTYADYTSMMLASIFIFIYLQARKNPKAILLLLLGFLLFASFKTKEVGACLVVFLFDRSLYQKTSDKKAISLKPLIYAGAGIIGGILVMALCDHFMLGDFFYGLRFSSWNTLLSYHTLARDMNELVDLFGALSRSGVLYLVFFSLYTIGILIKQKQAENVHHFLWAYEIATLAFLLLSAISGARMIVIRFFIVLAPALAILCAHIVSLVEDAIEKKTLLKLLLYLVICFAVSSCLSFAAGGLGWESDLFLERIFLPMLMLLSLFFFFHEKTWTRSMQAGLLGLMLLCLLPSKLTALHHRDIEHAFERRVHPLTENMDALTYSLQMDLFISSDIYSSHEILGRDRESNSWMYALLFHQDVDLDQFSYDEFLYENFVKGVFTSAFLSNHDWDSLDKEQQDAIGQAYSIRETNEYIFLSAE